MDEAVPQYEPVDDTRLNAEESRQQRDRLFGRTLRMLADTLEADLPDLTSNGVAAAPSGEPRELQQTVALLEKNYRSYTLEREQLSAMARELLSSCIQQIRAHFPQADWSVLDSFEAKLNRANTSFSALAALLASLVDIQRRLLDGQPEPEHASEPIAPALPLEASEAIKRLLDLLPLDEQGRKRARRISNNFNHELRASELVERLSEIVALLEQRSDNRVEEVADFLQSLARQLDDLYRELRESREADYRLDEQESQQTVQIDQGLEDLQQGLNSSTSFEELKSIISQQLSSLMDAFAEFKSSREERVRASEERYKRLLKQLELVEGDANSAKVAIDEERRRALTDHLTQLPNRRAYEGLLKAELHRWTRYRTQFSVLIIDIDHFKRINDTYGHLTGDRALTLVSQVLRKQLRESDTIARYGGEEFVVLLANTALESAQVTGEKLRRSIEKAPFKYNGHSVDIRISVGVTQAREQDTIETIFERADKALYRAKQAGRNRVEVG